MFPGKAEPLSDKVEVAEKSVAVAMKFSPISLERLQPDEA